MSYKFITSECKTRAKAIEMCRNEAKLIRDTEIGDFWQTPEEWENTQGDGLTVTEDTPVADIEAIAVMWDDWADRLQIRWDDSVVFGDEAKDAITIADLAAEIGVTEADIAAVISREGDIGREAHGKIVFTVGEAKMIHRHFSEIRQNVFTLESTDEIAWDIVQTHVGGLVLEVRYDDDTDTWDAFAMRPAYEEDRELEDFMELYGYSTRREAEMAISIWYADQAEETS